MDLLSLDGPVHSGRGVEWRHCRCQASKYWQAGEEDPQLSSFKCIPLLCEILVPPVSKCFTTKEQSIHLKMYAEVKGSLFYKTRRRAHHGSTHLQSEHLVGSRETRVQGQLQPHKMVMKLTTVQNIQIYIKDAKYIQEFNRKQLYFSVHLYLIRLCQCKGNSQTQSERTMQCWSGPSSRGQGRCGCVAQAMPSSELAMCRPTPGLLETQCCVPKNSQCCIYTNWEQQFVKQCIHVGQVTTAYNSNFREAQYFRLPHVPRLLCTCLLAHRHTHILRTIMIMINLQERGMKRGRKREKEFGCS